MTSKQKLKYCQGCKDNFYNGNNDMKGKAVTIPRGDMIVKAAEAGLSAVLDVLETHGKTTYAEASCISTLLRDMLMDGATSQAPTELDMFLATFGDKLMS